MALGSVPLNFPFTYNVFYALSTPDRSAICNDKPIETIGGVVLTSPDGSVRFDNTFEARLERMKPALRKEVAAILTGGI